jgi:hypothetical protein
MMFPANIWIKISARDRAAYRRASRRKHGFARNERESENACRLVVRAPHYDFGRLRTRSQLRLSADDGQFGSWQLFAFFRTPQPLRLQTRLTTRSSADRSSCAPCGGVLFACQGKLPICKLQTATEFAILLLKSLDPEPQRVATMFCLVARSRSSDVDAGGATSVVVLRDRMTRTRSTSWFTGRGARSHAR